LRVSRKLRRRRKKQIQGTNPGHGGGGGVELNAFLMGEMLAQLEMHVLRPKKPGTRERGCFRRAHRRAATYLPCSRIPTSRKWAALGGS
jgi:hypothetical protein